MTKLFLPNRWFLATLTVLLGAVATPGLQLIAIAATPRDIIRFNASDLPNPPGGGSEPTGRGSGGRRGCNNASASDDLIPLVPMAPKAKPSVRWGLTTEAHPTLWMHTGEGFPKGALVTLTMQDSTNQPLYRVQFQAPETDSGVARFAVPTSVPPLQPDRPYTWQLSVFCNSGDGSLADVSFDTPFHLRGSIQRITPSDQLKQALTQSSTPLERAIALAENGIWYDALTTLGNQVWNGSSTSKEITQAWSALLQQGQFDTAATDPIVPCCTPNLQ